MGLGHCSATSVSMSLGVWLSHCEAISVSMLLGLWLFHAKPPVCPWVWVCGFLTAVPSVSLWVWVSHCSAVKGAMALGLWLSHCCAFSVFVGLTAVLSMAPWLLVCGVLIAKPSMSLWVCGSYAVLSMAHGSGSVAFTLQSCQCLSGSLPAMPSKAPWLWVCDFLTAKLSLSP